MKETIKYLEKLIEDMSDCSWGIQEIVEYREIEEDETKYAELADGSLYKKQDDLYIHQTQGGEDYFYGTIIYPLTEKQALRIYYDC